MSGKNFVEESDILEQWRAWQKTGQVSESLAQQMLLIAQHLLNHERFKRYPKYAKDEMAQDGAIKCIKNLKNYNPSKGKIFSYFTQCCWSANMDYLTKYYKDMNLRRKLLLDALETIQTDPNIQESAAQRDLKKMLEDYEKDCQGEQE